MDTLIEIRRYLEKEVGLSVQWKQFNEGNAIFIHWHIGGEDTAIELSKVKIDPILGDKFSRTICRFSGWSWIIISKKL